VLLFDLPGLDVWHNEPRGHDAFEVCGHPPVRGSLARLPWPARHGRHLSFRWWPYLHVKKWLVDRCDHCGHRFRWRETRHSYQSTDRVWHGPCMSLRSVRGQLADLTGFVLGTADEPTRWRANHRLENLERAAKATADE
jgi:hypothetical protein